ncbi:hypothetical protein [Clostridium tagluense]|uniref:hypothetical protein n=1 Tax=Clostridium tagluense TaxID=360422 RepID=UPI001CF25862|nr:hypothetical protein [Clostridium tagluense]MCB2299209.1 hypothetical protein [Clostridium tagluense]
MLTLSKKRLWQYKYGYGIATLVDKNITPKETSADALANGFRTANEGTDRSYFAHVTKKYNLRFKQTENINKMLEAVKNVTYAVLSIQPPTFTRYGHLILEWNYLKLKFLC